MITNPRVNYAQLASELEANGPIGQDIAARAINHYLCKRWDFDCNRAHKTFGISKKLDGSGLCGSWSTRMMAMMTGRPLSLPMRYAFNWSQIVSLTHGSHVGKDQWSKCHNILANCTCSVPFRLLGLSNITFSQICNAHNFIQGYLTGVLPNVRLFYSADSSVRAQCEGAARLRYSPHCPNHH